MLGHDTSDVDFAYRASDTDRLREAVPALQAAGFSLLALGRHNNGIVTNISFSRFGIRFDFCGMFDQGHCFRTHQYLGNLQVTLEIPKQELEVFEMFGRSWRKVKDHELELTALYGEWRVPMPDSDVLYHCPALIDVVPRREFPYALIDLSDHPCT